jgi:oxygen-independent coproporphyrinogen-3 oxidase
VDQFSFLFKEILGKSSRSLQCEWTVECNPDSFSEEKAHAFLDAGVTRLSFGIQSLVDKELRLLGRIHNAQTASQVLQSPILSFFQSINADLMYGIPLQTIDTFTESLITLIKLPNIKHLSLYELTINEDTPFGRHYKKLPLPDDNQIANMSDSCTSICKKHGFEHYEISNYALPSFHSKHNEAYWDHHNYIGLGASAHSYIHPYRWSNISDTSTYIQKINNDSTAINFKEEIDGIKLANELLFLGLRRQIGINEQMFQSHTGKSFYNSNTKEKIDSFVDRGYLIYDSPWWRPTELGMHYADTMARDLFEC